MNRTRCWASVRIFCVTIGTWLAASIVCAQPAEKAADDAKRSLAVELRELTTQPPSELRALAQWYELDRGSLLRFYSTPQSPERRERLAQFGAAWLTALVRFDDSALSEAAGKELAALKARIRRDLARLDRDAKEQAEVAALVPFLPTVVELEASRRRIEPADGANAAAALTTLARQASELTQRAERDLQLAGGGNGNGPSAGDHELAKRAGEMVLSLRQTLRAWHAFYDGYDPLVTWWTTEPYKAADAALEKYAKSLGVKPPENARPGGIAGGGFPRFGSGRPNSDTDEPAEAIPFRIVEPATDLSEVPDLVALAKSDHSEMRAVLERYNRERFAQRGGTGGRGPGRGGAGSDERLTQPDEVERSARQEKLATDWLAALEELDFDSLSRQGRVDWLLLKGYLQRDLARLQLQSQERENSERWLPFAAAITQLDRARRRGEPPSAEETKELLESVVEKVRQAQTVVNKRFDASSDKLDLAARELPTVLRIIPLLDRQARMLAAAIEQFAKVDAEWRDATKTQAAAARESLAEYAALLQDKFIAARRWQAGGIEGQPIGREALLVELAGEMIPYSPEELLVIAEREYAWCETELRRAAREMGLENDLAAAVEKVKQMHVEPGKQPQLIRDLAKEAIDYVTRHDLVSVPPIARETWRMQMMTPERQLVNPFFTGGETISVSFPTSTMAHDAKLQSMRGNNIPFARATVHHELIPGHHLQGYMTARYQPQRGLFNTPFWGEGWALYWEMLLWDHGFVTTPEDCVGMLVWRMHRCARIVFSLSFHLGRMSPQECIDYLVARVGFDRDNATAEVRRSFGDRYSALYQAGYMLGGLQFRGLHQELVGSGRMTHRQFHDAVLKENRMPVAMVRAILTDQPLMRDYSPDWKFYGPVSQAP